MTRLSAPDRDFLAALADVVFGNPFTPQRNELIARLAPGAPLSGLTGDREALARVVEPRLEPWLREGAPALQKLSAEDRRLLEPGFLYVCYHRCVPQLDALIEKQVGQGGAPLPVPFADEAIADLVRSGFPEERAERFGHRKGAVTGAVEHHEGVFERCNAHGALFLDEIGEASIPVQIKLLQVLQERTFTALGGHEKKRFSGRVIAATNRPLAALRRDGRFRDDFFYRLCSDVIEVPTLRQRIAESPAELDRKSTRLNSSHVKI